MTVDDFQASRPHPWHGIPAGPNPPELIYAYIEITPFDLVKYEVDKSTGYLRVDRPQRTSSQPPTLYGFIPRTLCGERMRQLSPTSQRGDGDPLDVCVVSERPISKSEIIVTVRPIGGLQMVDGGDADDKIVAILDGDFVWGAVTDVSELPVVMMERIHHYFTTYKLVQGVEPRVSIERMYGRDLALQVIRAALADYHETFARYSSDEARQ